MKNQAIIICFIFILSKNTSCHNNRLKTDKKDLAKGKYYQENVKTEDEKPSREEETAYSINLIEKGNQLKEDQSVDPANPPVLINFAESLNGTKEYKLSYVASEISNVRLESIPDSAFLRTMKFKYYIYSDYIIATNPCGILLYSNDGRYLNTIVKNKNTGIRVEPDWVQIKGVNTFIGGGTSIWIYEGFLFYTYRDRITSQEYIMRYNLTEKSKVNSLEYDPENPDLVIGMGEIAININPSGKRAYWKYELPPEKVSWGVPADYLYQSVGTFLINNEVYAKELEKTNTIAIFNSKGDTITKLSHFNEGNSFRIENEGKQLLWNGFDDTIFQVASPYRIKPAIVLDFGKYKLTADQNGFDVKGKIIPRHIAENRNFIFMIYFMDSFDSQNDRKNKKVKMYHALYSKQNQKLEIIESDPYNYTSEILENDLDGGLPVWPLSHMIGNTGEILISLKGKQIKERVRTEQFKLSKAPASKKYELRRLSGLISDTEDILMIVK